MLLRGASKHVPYNYLFYIKGVEGGIVTFDKYLYYSHGGGQLLVDFAMRRNQSQWENPRMIFNDAELAEEQDLKLFVKGIFNSKDIRILKR